MFIISLHVVQHIVYFCLFVLLLYVSSQQLWSWRDSQFTKPHFFPGQAWTSSQPVLRTHNFACNWQQPFLNDLAKGRRMTVEIISWPISKKVWNRAGIKLATPESAVRLASVARHVTDCAARRILWFSGLFFSNYHIKYVWMGVVMYDLVHNVEAVFGLYRVHTGLKSTWIYRTVLKSPWKLKLPWKVIEKHSKALKITWIIPFTGGFNTDSIDSTLYLETSISMKLQCLYLVQHMLHQIKAPQFFTNFLKLIILVMDSSFSDVEF